MPVSHGIRCSVWDNTQLAKVLFLGYPPRIYDMTTRGTSLSQRRLIPSREKHPPCHVLLRDIGMQNKFSKRTDIKKYRNRNSRRSQVRCYSFLLALGHLQCPERLKCPYVACRCRAFRLVGSSTGTRRLA